MLFWGVDRERYASRRLRPLVPVRGWCGASCPARAEQVVIPGRRWLGGDEMGFRSRGRESRWRPLRPREQVRGHGSMALVGAVVAEVDPG